MAIWRSLRERTAVGWHQACNWGFTLCSAHVTISHPLGLWKGPPSLLSVVGNGNFMQTWLAALNLFHSPYPQTLHDSCREITGSSFIRVLRYLTFSQPLATGRISLTFG